MKRLFIATKIALNPSFLELTNKIKSGSSFDKIVWVNPSLMHLTLRFLGKTPEEHIPHIKKALQEVKENHASFELQLDKTGVFGSRYAPSVLWYGFSEFTPFRKLFEDLEQRLNAIAIDPACGNFVPHITIARIKKVDDKKRFWERIEKNQPLLLQTIKVDHLTLYQSKLTSQGPLYKDLFTIYF